ncbi:MAG TPA: SRPBCC family protein, partial [Chthoniobacterales bacterium]
MNRNRGNQLERSTRGRDIFAGSLGVFSLALGTAAIAAPRQVAKLIGVKHRPELFYAGGAREILIGLGILAQRRKAPWLWSAAAGGVMDLSLLSLALNERGSDKERIQGAAGVVGAALVASVICALQHSRGSRPIQVEKVIAIDRSTEELYRFWRQFENLPRFMRHLESVEVVGQTRSRWVAKGPAGTRVEWEAEVVDDRPDELISWRSLPGADVANSGSVRFERA